MYSSVTVRPVCSRSSPCPLHRGAARRRRRAGHLRRPALLRTATAGRRGVVLLGLGAARPATTQHREADRRESRETRPRAARAVRGGRRTPCPSTPAHGWPWGSAWTPCPPQTRAPAGPADRRPFVRLPTVPASRPGRAAGEPLCVRPSRPLLPASTPYVPSSSPDGVIAPDARPRTRGRPPPAASPFSMTDTGSVNSSSESASSSVAAACADATRTAAVCGWARQARAGAQRAVPAWAAARTRRSSMSRS